MSGQAVAVAGGAGRATRRLRTRHLLFIPGLAIALYANALAGSHDLGLVIVIAFGILPHLTVLLRRVPGPLAATSVPAFNVMHHPLPPLAILVLATVGLVPSISIVAALAWLSHIVVDRALGDGRRSADLSRANRLAPAPVGAG